MSFISEIDYSFFDDFYLTKTFATNDLREKVTVLHQKLAEKEIDYDAMLREAVGQNATLTKMEQKAVFVVEELQRAKTMFIAPEIGHVETDPDKSLEQLMTGLEHAGTALTIGWIAGGISSWRMLKEVRHLEKLFGKNSPVTLKAKGAPKMLRAAKLGKYAKRAGTAGLVIAGLIYLLSISETKKFNDQLKADRKAMEKQLGEVAEAMDEMEQDLVDNQKSMDDMMEDVGATTVAGYIELMNKAISEIGAQIANLSTARRMLIDGMPEPMVMKYSKLSAEAFKNLNARVSMERAILEGKSDKDASTAIGVTPAEVANVRGLVDLRRVLLEGEDSAHQQAREDFSPLVFETETMRMEEELKPFWAGFETGKGAPLASTQMLLSEASMTHVITELKAKLAMASGDTSTSFKLTPEQTAEYAEELAEGQNYADKERKNGGLKDRELNLAIRLRLPLSLMPSAA